MLSEPSVKSSQSVSEGSCFRKDMLSGRVFVVSGGGSGICLGIVRSLVAHGAKVAITSRSIDRLQRAADDINKDYPAAVFPVAADVRDFDALMAAMLAVKTQFGHVDSLVNGAAGNFLCPAESLSANGFGTVIDIDVKGTWNLTRAVFDTFYKGSQSDHAGERNIESRRVAPLNIVNISATLHYGGTPLQVHVAAAKAAIDAMTQTLAVEWGPYGIRVNAIAPGPIADTEGAKRLFPEDMAKEIASMTPIRRIGKIEDVVNIALFLFSPLASNVTGAIFVTDGGLSLPKASVWSLDSFDSAMLKRS